MSSGPRQPEKQWTNEREDRLSRVVFHKTDDGKVIVMVQQVHGPSASGTLELEDRWSAAKFLAGIEDDAAPMSPHGQVDEEAEVSGEEERGGAG